MSVVKELQHQLEMLLEWLYCHAWEGSRQALYGSSALLRADLLPAPADCSNMKGRPRLAPGPYHRPCLVLWLQAGSLIVDALRTYRRPAFVYLPPGTELRGGAWVVIDSAINPNQVGVAPHRCSAGKSSANIPCPQVETCADTGARGGVIKPLS